VPAVTKAPAGQVAELPVQVGCNSQGPAWVPQEVPEGSKPLAGHAAPPPGQTAAMSQPEPEAARQVVPAAYFAQAPLPSQLPLVPHEAAP